MFERFARWVDTLTSSPAAFAVACGVVLVWALAGPFFGFSDTWQLVINTGTTVVTFLMMFLLANSQTRSAERHFALTEHIERQDAQMLEMEKKQLAMEERILRRLPAERRTRS